MNWKEYLKYPKWAIWLMMILPFIGGLSLGIAIMSFLK